jgi:D-sedoheptulose 7-phosphate isomerase
MSLSTTSLAFLRELHKALEGVEVDGPAPDLRYRVILIGNGGSAAIAAHIANDIVKSENPAITPTWETMSCLANDFGWEEALRQWIRAHYNPGELDDVIAISSSGQSHNILNACSEIVTEHLITFTGFDADNPVRKLGHTNYWVPSHNYGVVECAHLAILHSIVNPGAI